MKIILFIGLFVFTSLDNITEQTSDDSRRYINKYTQINSNYACDGSREIMLLTNSHQKTAIRVYYTRYNIYSKDNTIKHLVNDVNPRKETFIGRAWNMAFVIDSTKFIQ
jgi:hypothetical protein